MPRHHKLPLICLTMGEPSGIGPRVAIEAARDSELNRMARILLIGDAWIAKRYAGRCRIRPVLNLEEHHISPGVLDVLHVPHPAIQKILWGQPSRTGGEAAVQYLKTGTALCLSGRAQALVTGPVSKESLKSAGVRFPGHTEYLAYLCGTSQTEMIMSANGITTLLLTRHIPLSLVGQALSKRRILEAVTLAGRFLEGTVKRRNLRITFCGLNPHAGNSGLIGKEEIKIFLPAIKKLKRERKWLVEGPYPADSVFAGISKMKKKGKGKFSHQLVVCAYHDQAMIPLKTLTPNQVVNITAGLPFIRTSPGHGTAFDLGPTFAHADPTAMKEAVRKAVELLKSNSKL